MSLKDWQVRLCAVEADEFELKRLNCCSMEVKEIEHWINCTLKKHHRYRELIGGITETIAWPEPHWPMLVPKKWLSGGSPEEPYYSWAHDFRFRSLDPEGNGKMDRPATRWPKELVNGESCPFIAWIEQVRPIPKLIEKPADHVRNGTKCETCRFFSLQHGQQWLSTVTHPFAGGDKFHKKMWEDIIGIEMVVNKAETASINDFGCCIIHDKLIVQHAIACNDYVVHSQHANKAVLSE